MKVIYNPNCNKCRVLEKTLENHAMNWEKVEYLNTGLTPEMIALIERVHANSDGCYPFLPG